jgi:hypothetical protein
MTAVWSVYVAVKTASDQACVILRIIEPTAAKVLT